MDLTSRFFTKEDAHEDHLIMPLPPAWWSRPYEYTWAKQFTGKEFTVLDAACGLEHPFKYYLVDTCREVFACDIDKRILSTEAITGEIKSTFGNDALTLLDEKHLHGIHYAVASLVKLPYDDGMFDRIFCISVIEHLKDFFNRHPEIPPTRFLRLFFRHEIRTSLSEFRRTLKDDGLIILTLDYPDVNLSYLSGVIQSIGLSFAGPVDTTLPANALYSEKMKLWCFRAVLSKQ